MQHEIKKKKELKQKIKEKRKEEGHEITAREKKVRMDEKCRVIQTTRC